ncbi:MAG TPA: hypothetical protein VM658_04710 [bacterium]|nr:hypothetical protein [bacterium]
MRSRKFRGLLCAVVLAVAAGSLFGGVSQAGEAASGFLPLGVDPDEPQILVTVEYMSYDELMKPEVMAFLKKYNILVAPVIRANLLNDDLDRLYAAYEQAGIKIVFWPLLPREQCLYLNETYADAYLAHLDKIYAWAGQHHHQIEALIVDIEPPNCQQGTDLGPEEQPQTGIDLGSVFTMLNKEEFDASIPKFQAVLDKLHAHGTTAISTAMDYAAVDLESGRPVLQDISGGPSQIINWDYYSYMSFGSQNTASLQELLSGLHLKWTADDTRYLTYILGRVMAGKFGNRAAISLGQTIPGEGHGAVWTDPAELGKDAAAYKAAGIIHFAIYDFQGIIESPDPDAWILAIKNAKPEKPKYSAKAAMVWDIIKLLSWYGETRR